jgi:hypothetical protein
MPFTTRPFVFNIITHLMQLQQEKDYKTEEIRNWIKNTHRVNKISSQIRDTVLGARVRPSPPPRHGTYSSELLTRKFMTEKFTIIMGIGCTHVSNFPSSPF